jgi:peroxin-2
MASQVVSQVVPFLRSSDRALASKVPKQLKGRYWPLPLDQCAICASKGAQGLDVLQSANPVISLSPEPSESLAPPPSTTSTDEESPPFPVNTPYITSCGHIYCYNCVAEQMMQSAEDSNTVESTWVCLRCSQPVKEADRLLIDEDMESEMNTSDYEFSSDMDVTDLSGSIGSYSESMLSSDVH